jgi:arsenical pump membrane protein
VRVVRRRFTPSPVGLLAAFGVASALVAALASESDAQSALDQVWSPFVLVTGLLLVGLVANADGLFARLGARPAGLVSSRR